MWSHSLRLGSTITSGVGKWWEEWTSRLMEGPSIHDLHMLNAVPALGAVRGVGAGVKATKGATSLLQAPRQIEAAWGASTYRHGGLMTGIEHIMYRHGSNSGFSNVSRFAEGTRMGDISRYVDSALRSGTVMGTGKGAYTVEYNLGRTIGSDVAGNAASSIRVHVRDGVIQTAFPF